MATTSPPSWCLRKRSASSPDRRCAADVCIFLPPRSCTHTTQIISPACSPPLPPLCPASPSLSPTRRATHTRVLRSPLGADLLPLASQGNFLRQVEEEWGTLMFFADYRSKDRGQSVTPACTHACLRRSGTTPWATRAAPRRPRPGPRGRERTVWRRVARARSSPGLCYQRSRPPHGYSRPPLYLITLPHHSASTDQHLYIPLTGPLHPLNWHLGPLAAPPPTTATYHDHLPLPRVP